MPKGKIEKKIENLKNDIKNRFGLKHALKLPAHITLQIPFRMQVDMEDVLVKKLQNFTEERKSFTTKLDGFGRFAKNVIFVNVVDHDPYIKLHEELQEFMLNFIDLKSHEISSKIHPHITLATRDLKRGHFPGIWDHFKKKEFSETFRAEHLHLLKHNGETWDVIGKFQLGSKI